MSGSSSLDEAVEHLLRPGLLEFYVQLVAVDRHHAAVAELLVEHALADREVGLVALHGAAVVHGLVAPAGAGAAHAGDAEALVIEARGLIAQAAVMAG